jgi:glycosyltransferase involved in cell wall biosynthesis
VSRLDEFAGLETLLDAVSQLHEKGGDIQVAIVGDTADASPLWQRLRARKINECCVVLDNARLWEKGLMGADVCVVPGCQRDLWLAPLLAMGLGRLVIAARDQIADWFIEDQTAWQFTPGSSVELAYLLTRAMEQPKHVRRITASAVDYFHAHHTVGGLVDAMHAAYARILGDIVEAGAPREEGGDAQGCG